MLFLKKNNNDVNLFDEMSGLFDEFIRPRSGFMKTDIQETENEYTIEMDIPGYNKEDIKISVDDQYLTISVNRETKIEEQEKDKYIRRERTVQSGNRSFYVGEVEESDIKAKFNNGVLTVNIPKKDVKQETKKIIEIE